MPTKPSNLGKTTETPITNASTVVNDLTKIWKMKKNVKILNEICPLNDTDRACDLFEACVSNLTMILKEIEYKLLRKTHDEYEMTPHQTWMHFVTVNIAFYAGLLLGAFFGGCFVYLLIVIVTKCFVKKKISDEEVRRNQIRNRAQSKLRFIEINTIILV